MLPVITTSQGNVDINIYTVSQKNCFNENFHYELIFQNSHSMKITIEVLICDYTISGSVKMKLLIAIILLSTVLL